VAITLNVYRSRFLPGESRDRRYDDLRRRLAEVEHLSTPTLMVQGGSDYCDPPAHSEGLEDHFTGHYRRVVIDGVGHFPHREATEAVAELAHEHLSTHQPRVRMPSPRGPGGIPASARPVRHDGAYRGGRNARQRE